MTKKAVSPEIMNQCSESGRLPEEVLINDITLDQKYQTRVEGIDEDTVEEYEPIYAESPERMPPIVLVRIKGKLYLVAGFQRIEAATRAGCTSIRAIVIDGDEKIAMKEALGSNKHGLKLSSGDKTKAIGMATEAFPEYSNVRIAELVGCSESMVRKVRGNEDPDRTGANPSDKVVGKDGKPQARHKKSRKATPTKTEEANDNIEVVAEGHDETAGTSDTQETLADNDSEDVDDGDHGVASGTGSSTDGSTSQDVFFLSSNGLQDIEDDAFAIEFADWVRDLPIDDERRLALFRKLIKKLLRGFKKREYCNSLREWLAEYLEPSAQ